MSNVQRGTGNITGKKKGPSISDVARLAGVSAQTVSRVSTGAEVVRPETRERVLAAMTKLGYAPNRAARALRNGSSRTIGVITQQLDRTGETLTTAAVTEALELEGYSVNLIQVHNPESAQLSEASSRLVRQAVDGLIIVRAGHAGSESLSLPPDLPVAVSDSRLVTHFPSVVPDQVQGTRDAVLHLLELGHRTVHHIAGSADSHPALARSAAWARVLAESGVPAPPQWEGDWTPQSGYLIGQQIARDPSITAVYCANDEMAFGLMRALYEHGRRVPDDVSVVGFDGIALSEFSSPPLTTIKQDFSRIGRELTRLVLAAVHGHADTVTRHVVVPTELLVRGTTAPPS